MADIVFTPEDVEKLKDEIGVIESMAQTILDACTLSLAALDLTIEESAVPG